MVRKTWMDITMNVLKRQHTILMIGVVEKPMETDDNDGDLEGYQGGDMFYMENENYIDPEQIDPEMDVEDNDSEPPPLIPRKRSKEPRDITWKRNKQ